MGADRSWLAPTPKRRRLITSDIVRRTGPFIRERTSAGIHVLRGGIDAAIARGIAMRPMRPT